MHQRSQVPSLWRVKSSQSNGLSDDVVDYLRSEAHATTKSQIRDHLRQRPNLAGLAREDQVRLDSKLSRVLRRLVADGQLVHPARGVYQVPDNDAVAAASKPEPEPVAPVPAAVIAQELKTARRVTRVTARQPVPVVVEAEPEVEPEPIVEAIVAKPDPEPELAPVILVLPSPRIAGDTVPVVNGPVVNGPVVNGPVVNGPKDAKSSPRHKRSTKQRRRMSKPMSAAILVIAPIVWLAIGLMTIIFAGVLIAGIVFWVATAVLVWLASRAIPPWTRPEPHYVSEPVFAADFLEQTSGTMPQVAQDRVSALARN